MKIRFEIMFVSVLLLHWPASSAPIDGETFFTEYTERSFRKLPAANQLIDPERVNRHLLDAAVFHETNRRRQTEDLEPLRYEARARQAAAIQSRAMAKTGVV